jgi:hypothetical protein
MDKITITINTTNSAFDPENNGQNYEIARILREIADCFDKDYSIINVMDINGNCVGSIETE